MTIIDKEMRRILLILILVLASFFRFSGLTTREIWYDEALDVLQAEKSLVQISKDVQTPIHYYIVHFFLIFGKNTYVLGFPSVIFGIASVYMVYLIGKKIYDEDLGLIAGLLAAVSPMLIEFSQQILHYSYFIFFTLLALNFYLNIFSDLKSGKFIWHPVAFFFAFTALNVLTHPSSLLVLAIESSYFFLVIIFSKKMFKKTVRFHPLIILVISILPFLLFKFGGNAGGYLHTIGDIRLNISKSMEVGYSLTGQLGSTLLVFNLTFFKAMFAWFGLGRGLYLGGYFFLFVMGLIFFVLKRKWSELIFVIYWITTPFIFLYLFKMTHWFEEKYFFFILPIYLITIAAGIYLFCKLASRGTDYVLRNQNNEISCSNKIAYLLEVVISIIMILISIYPNKIRTVYGFKRLDDPGYSMPRAINYLLSNTLKSDKVFIRNGEGLFLKFYLNNQDENKYWFEEKYVLSLTPGEYLLLVNNNYKTYFVSIPDFPDTFLGDLATYKKLANPGYFNVYEIRFIKKSPDIMVKTGTEIEYYDDFRTAKYLSDAKDWKNVSISYSGNFNLPMTYGYYTLFPVNKKPSYIDYEFIPRRKKPFVIRPSFTLSKSASFKVLIGTSSASLNTIYTQQFNGALFYSPEITIPEMPKTFNNRAYLRFLFEHDQDSGFIPGGSSLKSFLITTQVSRGTRLINSIKQERAEYSYESQLEITRSNGWLYQTIENKGWIQSTDGVLFNLYGDSNSPLIYKFYFSSPVDKFKLKLKTYSLNNQGRLSVSEDGFVWKNLLTFNDGKIATHDVEYIADRPKSEIYLKFECPKGGPTCQLRDYWLIALRSRQ